MPTLQLKNITYLATKDLTVYEGSIGDNINILTPNEIFNVMDYKMVTQRPLNAKGVPYKTNVTNSLHLVIDAGSQDSCIYLYDALASRSLASFTMLFYQVLGNSGPKYNNAAVLEGYVTSIKEDFETIKGESKLFLTLDMLTKNFHFVNTDCDLSTFLGF